LNATLEPTTAAADQNIHHRLLDTDGVTELRECRPLSLQRFKNGLQRKVLFLFISRRAMQSFGNRYTIQIAENHCRNLLRRKLEYQYQDE